MNWFVKKSNTVVTAADDRCQHLNDGDTAYHRSAEMDSFGPVGRFCYCKACYEEAFTTREIVGGDYILEAVRAAVKGYVSRYDEQDPEEKEFLRVLATADLVGIQLRKEVIPPEEWDTRGVERVEYRPVFRATILGLLPVEYISQDRVWSWSWGCEFLDRLGEQLMQLTQTVIFDDERGLYQLSPHVGYMVGVNRVYDFDGNAVSDYHWTDKKPESFEMRPLGDYAIVRCGDCGKDKFKYLTTEWRWFDFYAPQGDEPLVICDCCRKLPKHCERVRKDTADYNHEMGFDVQGDEHDNYPDEEPETQEEADAIEARHNTDDLPEEAEAAYVEGDQVAFLSGVDHAKTLESAKAYLAQREGDLIKLKVQLWDNLGTIAPGWQLRRYPDGTAVVCSVKSEDVDWAQMFMTTEQALAYILARWW
jgi:hypothetical protein